MSTPRWPIQLAGSVSLSLMAMTVGCQSVRGEMRHAAAKSAGVPPLSALPAPSQAADSSHLSAAPIELAHGTSTPVSASAPTLVPTLPTADHALPPGPPTMLGAQRPAGQLPIDPARSQGTLQTSAACLPAETDWRKQMEEQTAALVKRLGQMEGELASTRQELQTVSASLKGSQARIEQLNQEVSHWKGEVKRLETDMRTQQLADLKSLDELTESMHQVLLRQRGPSPQKEHSP